ncbi:hypothetical protein [uncultured Bradyrhizobium sp.]|jgi:hypothetical protein|uniref:hypothetical protein n=1 Tax=uncultured Bradyrhizobium sp. TaxID=199684 RepID=UPI002611CEEE|nr:hypothetical protein [uncultured Bradyrhizobium sp.]
MSNLFAFDDIGIAQRVRELCAPEKARFDEDARDPRRPEVLKRDLALVLARALRDDMMRAAALREIINFCMNTDDAHTALSIFKEIKSPLIAALVLVDHPVLGDDGGSHLISTEDFEIEDPAEPPVECTSSFAPLRVIECEQFKQEIASRTTWTSTPQVRNDCLPVCSRAPASERAEKASRQLPAEQLSTLPNFRFRFD